MTWKSLFVFFLAFQIEVRVRADHVLEPMGEPERCWIRALGPCSVQAGTKALNLRSGEAELWASGESLLSREKSAWRFLKGSVRARSEKAGSLAFPQGEVATESGEFWILEDGDRYVIRAVRGSALVKTRDGRTLEVPEGLEVWIGAYLASGVVSHGVPALVPINDHLKRWAALNDVPAAEFLRQARELRELWKQRTSIASAIYEQVSQRQLASVKEEEDRVAARARAERERRSQNRAMLFEHAFGR